MAISKSDVWPPRVWVDLPGLNFTAETNKGAFTVCIAADAAPGPRLVRLYNEDGSSDPHCFVIGGGREISDLEPNNSVGKAQATGPLPVTINGRLDKNGDVDSFAIELRAGDWLDARMDCYTLMSKVDAVLRLVSTNGEQLAWNHDFITLDPRLVWRATHNGTVVLELFGFAYPPDSGITLTGGDNAVYRLHLATSRREPALCDPPTEREPNDTPETAQAIELPAVIHGTIGSATDEDRFHFKATKNTFIEAQVEAASLGSPLDAWVQIEDATGRSIARNDDAEGSRDPRLEWKPGTNGEFLVTVGGVTHRGGETYRYRLSVRRAEPDFRAALAAGSLELNLGATNELKLDVKRFRGFTNELSAVFRDLPPGVTLLTNRLSAKDGAISLQLVADADVQRFQGPVGLFLLDAVTQRERAVPFDLTTRGETGYNHLLVESTDRFWLTVRPKPAKVK